MLQSMESQRVEYDLVTQQQQQWVNLEASYDIMWEQQQQQQKTD